MDSERKAHNHVAFFENYMSVEPNSSRLQNFKSAIQRWNKVAKNEKQRKKSQNWKQIERKISFNINFKFCTYEIVTNSHDKFKSF